MTHRLLAATAAVLLSGVLAATEQAMTATDAWVREPVPGRSVTAAFIVLENPGPADLHIVSASADVAGTVELHEMVRSGDMMKMAPVGRITVPAKGRVELRPGGLHMMLFELKRPLREGDEVQLTLTTDTGASVKASAPVKKMRMQP